MGGSLGALAQGPCRRRSAAFGRRLRPTAAGTDSALVAPAGLERIAVLGPCRPRFEARCCRGALELLSHDRAVDVVAWFIMIMHTVHYRFTFCKSATPYPPEASQ
jgi:hypothetical protein